MKHFFLSTILCLLLVSFIGCKGKKVQSRWASDIITIDGNGDDWQDKSLNFNDDPEIVYGIANNDTSINFLLQFNSQDLARKINRRGMILWLDENDGKDKILGIHYRDESVRGPMPGMEGEFNRKNTSQRPDSQMPVHLMGRFTLDVQDSLTGKDIADIPGLQAAADFKDGVYSFEFRVALNDSTKSQFLSLGQDDKLGACLEICGMSDEEKARMKSIMSERPAQGGGRGGMGGGRGGGRGDMSGSGGGPGMSMPDINSQEIWLRIALSSKETIQ